MHSSFVSSESLFGTLIITNLLRGAFFDFSVIVFLYYCGCGAIVNLRNHLVYSFAVYSIAFNAIHTISFNNLLDF